MKSAFGRVTGGWVWCVVALGIGWISGRCEAQQDNSWSSPTSGNWEDSSSWSLGATPGTNQNILLTNAGWKAVQIGSGTAANFPDSLTVNSITISSPSNSFNSLLLNYAGSAPPLTVQTITVSSNSAMKMSASALQINGAGMTVGGEFDQDDGSVVGGNEVNVGGIGPAVYNFNSGYLAVWQLSLGGTNGGGVLFQNGGTNEYGFTRLEDGGAYVLSNGVFGTYMYFDGGELDQYGGLLVTNLAIANGNYRLAGGILLGGATVPSVDGYSNGRGGMWQTGGTNYGSLLIGLDGYGTYVMSNGVSAASELEVAWGGTYDQWDGVQTTTDLCAITEEQVDAYDYSWGAMNLHGGQISSRKMEIGGHYTQDGGTNQVAGLLFMVGTHASLTLSGGLLTANSMEVSPSWIGGVFLTGGTLIVSNELSVGGTSLPGWQGVMAGGQLIVSNLWLGGQSRFYAGGAITQSGLLSMYNASLYIAANALQFGPLFIGGDATNNSTIYMPSNTAIVNFADSSGVTWSNGPSLIVENWSGSLAGGGQQQIVFGNNSSALTAQQLAQIQFHNPAGLAAGDYPATILSTGEIVPRADFPTQASISIAPQSNGIQLTLQGQAGRTYSIEVSTDLVHWVPWTNQMNTNGTMHITDTANLPARYYRARLMP